MKDHRLSELEFCDCHCPYHGEPNGCNRAEGECEAYRQYLELVELEEETKSKDMIELPCKEHFVYKHKDGHITENWRVYYRGKFDFIETAISQIEAEADAFLAELRRK